MERRRYSEKASSKKKDNITNLTLWLIFGAATGIGAVLISQDKTHIDRGYYWIFEENNTIEITVKENLYADLTIKHSPEQIEELRGILPHVRRRCTVANESEPDFTPNHIFYFPSEQSARECITVLRELYPDQRK
jgi:hypothetical protein